MPGHAGLRLFTSTGNQSDTLPNSFEVSCHVARGRTVGVDQSRDRYEIDPYANSSLGCDRAIRK